MEAPIPDSRLTLAAGAAPAVKQAVRCQATELKKTDSGLQFQRLDQVLPVVPPVALDRLPQEPCPVIKYSPYFLTVTDLPEGTYERGVEKTVLGRETQEERAAGVNLNAVYLKTGPGGAPPKFPWARLWEVCRDKNLDKEANFTPQETVGKASWQWELRR